MATDTGADTSTWTIGDADTRRRVLLGAILLTALAQRVYRIGSLFPLMVDEAIYLRWGEIILHQNQWFVALLDGKQPLMSWLYALLLIARPDDPFLAARLMSVVAGVAATFLLFIVARVLGGAEAGLWASAYYAVAPYAVFYSHIAYNEPFLDLISIAAALSALMTFVLRPPSWWMAAATGLWLGLGFLCKSTFLPFFAFPLAICVLQARDRRRLLLATYGVAALILAILYLSIPAAPISASNHFFIHQMRYFIDRETLLSEPWAEVGFNLPLIAGYLNVYLTPLVPIAGVAAFLILWKRHLLVPALLVPFVIAVLCAECVVLYFLPSRYLFPFLWPLFVAIACGLAVAPRRRLAALLAVVVLAAMAARSVGILVAPARALHAVDVDHFIKANRYAGYGVPEAAAFIRRTARKEEQLVVLTDPIWGLPADAMFVYLQGRDGIAVHEAWWTQLSERHPLLPEGPVALMKSHYERVYGGSIDFDRIRSVLYVTDSANTTVADVLRRQRNARRIASFVKPGGVDRIDVYRLR